jgi:multifunctional methyltransferase subunit TRM112
MKLLTLNFLTCAVKTCKTQAASFPLHPKDSELEILETDMNLPFLRNILPRLMWEELRTICKEVCRGDGSDRPTSSSSIPDCCSTPAYMTPTKQRDRASAYLLT